MDKEIEVFEEGRKVMRPDIVQFLSQAAQLAQVIKLRSLEESKIPTGADSRTFSVGTDIYEYKSGYLWISFTLVNDGPNPVYIGINDIGDLGKVTPVNVSESYTFDGVYPVVHTLYLQAATGLANVRIQAKRGEWRTAGAKLEEYEKFIRSLK